MKESQLFQFSIIASLSIGLAPFVPEPHIWKQILNLYYARPMLALDWLDIVMHGTPWILFIVLGIRKLRIRSSSN